MHINNEVNSGAEVFYKRTGIFCDTYLTQYIFNIETVIFKGTSCSQLQAVCGTDRVFTEQLFGTLNSSNVALTSNSGGYLRIINAGSGCHAQD